ncbi:molybdenum cofactor guanylyltransferase [Candidatus Pelagibacter sp.]|nr:molybdenum cofactor guanylyltransferase [Candidatus Pelagibacter sp.]|tara:strand:- start:572 stop:1192 length:621 start_codon:yes stop_codon:yes gene_type:complete
MDHNNILAVVLAGGKSKRFGRDKSQVKLGNKILIDYILDEIIDFYKDILVVTNEPIKFSNSNKISLTSDFQKGLGPLGGVLSAMKWIKDNKKNYKWISTFPIDTPFFKKKHLNKFYKEVDLNKSNLFFMKSKNTRHNIFGLWSLELYEKLEFALNKGDRKVELWANKMGVKTIDFDHENNKDPFFNINTEEDLKTAKILLENDKLS